MSKHGLDYLTDSNVSRTPFDIHFKAFESHMRNGAAALEFSRIRSNALERTALPEARHA